MRLNTSIPLVLFAGILVMGYLAFQLGDRHQLPSALIDRDFPEFVAPDLYDPASTIARADIVGFPVLVNVWATWCPTCKAEHEFLMEIAARSDVRIVGVNYKDDRIKALQWLADYGDPYDAVLMDLDGALGVELGVYGAPETFLLDATGKVLYKRVGDVNARIWQAEIAPRLEDLGVLIAQLD